MDKPEKKTYKNQQEVHDTIVECVRSELRNVACEAYLIGSATTGTFGKYQEKYGVHEGSDVDLVVFIEKTNIPKNWKYLNTEKEWWKLYRIGKLEIHGTVHRLDAMIVKPGKEDRARTRMKELGWKPEKMA